MFWETSPSLPTVPSPEGLCSSGMLLPTQPCSMQGHCCSLGSPESQHQKQSPMSPASDSGVMVLPELPQPTLFFRLCQTEGFRLHREGGHSSGPAFFEGLILRRMHRHAQQPELHRPGQRHSPACAGLVPFAAARDPSAAQICPQQSLKSNKTQIVAAKALPQGLQHFTDCQAEV